MRHMRHTINNRIAHIDIGALHVNLGTKRHGTVRHFTVFHFFKQLKRLFRGTISVGIVFPRFAERSSVLTHLLCRERGYIGLAFFDQTHGCIIHIRKIIGCIEHGLRISFHQPVHVFDNGMHELFFFFGGIGVVKAQQKTTVILTRQSTV